MGLLWFLRGIKKQPTSAGITQSKSDSKKTWWLSIDNKIDWDDLAKNLTKHRQQIRTAKTSLQMLGGLPDAAAFDFAITDLITEKAVDHLSRRSTVYYRSAWLLLFFTGISIGAAIWWFNTNDIAHFIGSINQQFKTDNITRGSEYFTSSQVVTLFLVRSVTMGALFAAAPAILGGLSFSYFHEATAAYHQRHLIRFGRLWVELQLSGEKPEKPKWEHFKQAFVFDYQPATAFRRLRMPKSITGETAEIIKALASLLKNERSAESSDKH